MRSFLRHLTAALLFCSDLFPLSFVKKKKKILEIDECDRATLHSGNPGLYPYKFTAIQLYNSLAINAESRQSLTNMLSWGHKKGEMLAPKVPCELLKHFNNNNNK